MINSAIIQKNINKEYEIEFYKYAQRILLPKIKEATNDIKK